MYRVPGITSQLEKARNGPLSSDDVVQMGCSLCFIVDRAELKKHESQVPFNQNASSFHDLELGLDDHVKLVTDMFYCPNYNENITQ